LKIKVVKIVSTSNTSGDFTMWIRENGGLEIFTEGDMIIFKKYGKVCANCNCREITNLKKFGQITLCQDCIVTGKEIV